MSGTFQKGAKVVNSLSGETLCIPVYGAINCQLEFERCQKMDKNLGNFHEPRTVVNSLSGSIAGMARRRRSAAVRQSCLQHEPIRIKMP